MNGICGPGCASYQANAQSATLAVGPRGGLYFVTKYTAPSSAIPVIRWQEAQLIIAEERLEAGDLASAVTRINSVRLGATPAQSSFASTVAATIKTQLIHERQTEFFLEGRNWQDMRNYKIVPKRWTAQAIAAVTPSGTGIARRLPISPREIQANPNF